MTHRMGTKGQVVIPKAIRERHRLGPGTAVAFEEQDDAIVVRRVDSRRPLKGRYAGGNLAASLLEDRRREEAQGR